MPNIAIAYFSGAGHTRRLAEEIANALGQAECNARLIDVEVMFRIDWNALASADAILMGSPTYMGSVAGPFKAFMDATSDIWENQGWRDKMAAGFTVAGYPAGDKLATLIQMAVFATQHGMIWVGQDQIGAPVNPDNPGINASGTWMGLAATADADHARKLSEAELETARRFAHRIARAVQRWSPPAPENPA